MKRLLSFAAASGVAVLALCGSPTLTQAQASQSDQALRDCMRLPDPNRNITDCTTVIDRGDREPARSRAIAHLNRAIAYLQKGEGERGLADLNAAIALQPDFVAAYYNRALYYHRSGDLERAKIDYSRVLELDPKMVNAYGNRGGVSYAQGALDDALKDFQAALDLAPDNAGLIHQIGIIYLAKSELKRAITYFDRAIALAPKAPRFRFSRGQAYARQGAFAQARDDFAAAHERDPRHAESRACLQATENALAKAHGTTRPPALPDYCVRDTKLPG